MAKVTVTIEETVSQEFILDIPDDVDIDDYIEKQYKIGNLVLSPGELQSVQYMTEVDGEVSSWVEIY